jgi:hypothetical protein
MTVLPAEGGITKMKEKCAVEDDTSTPTNDVNQDMRKHERLPTIEYLIIEGLLLLTPFSGTCQDNQNGLIGSRKFVVLY